MSCPQPVYASDTPLVELRTAELLLVTTLRCFALLWRDPQGVHPDWRGGFRAAGIEICAGPAFDALFRTVATVPRRSLDVRCPHCTSLGADEGRLLQLISLLHRDRAEDAQAILGEWLSPAAVRMAIPAAQGLAAAMAHSGLIVPLRHREAAMVHRMTPAHADRGLVLVQ